MLYVLRFTFYAQRRLTILMSDTAPESGADGPRSPSWRRWLRVLLPHILTAALAIAISLAAQAMLLHPTTPAFIVPTPAPPTLSPPPEPTATPAPAGVVPAPAPAIVRQELLDLRAEDDRLSAALYLAKAISQVSDAESQMRANDLENVAQSLVA